METVAGYITVKVINLFLIMSVITYIGYFVADWIVRKWGGK